MDSILYKPVYSYNLSRRKRNRPTNPFQLLGIIIFLFMGYIAPLGAQDIKEDIARINQSYLNTGSFQQEIHFSLFTTFESNQAIESYTAFVQRKGDAFYMKREGTESLSNDRMSLLIDHNRKAIIIQNPVKSDISTMGTLELDSLLLLCEKTVYEKRPKNRGVYHFHMKSYKYKKISVEFDHDIFFLRKLTLWSADEENPFRIETSFANIKRDIPIATQSFSERKFISQKSGTYSPNASFATYQLLNYLNEQ